MPTKARSVHEPERIGFVITTALGNRNKLMIRLDNGEYLAALRVIVG
jgi:hypothetical protein